ncbi:MAG: arginase family protein [Candidatus Methanofastidiosa archaeon]|nr:arginase family protein [Candidatus Methanofastidiosa archaeon]
MEGVVVFGVPLDPDEREDVVMMKNDPKLRSSIRVKDPYTAVSERLSFKKELIGSAPVEPWLTPFPPDEMLFMCTVENYVTFIDCDGCWEYAMAIKDSMGDLVGDRRSLMIAVDHSAACASMIRSSEAYGKEDCGIIIFDSHFDGILPSYRCGLIQHDIDTNPNSPFDPDDPFIFGRSESFNADSFLFKLIDEKYVLPENVMVVGVSDYPSAKAEKLGDERVSRYIDFYHGYEERGVTVIPKERLRANPRLFDMGKLDVGNLHVSIDVDVGSRMALHGARFIDYKGLSEREIFNLLGGIRTSGKRIVSADISEIDVWKAGRMFSGKKDRTYEIASKMGNALFL